MKELSFLHFLFFWGFFFRITIYANTRQPVYLYILQFSFTKSITEKGHFDLPSNKLNVAVLSCVKWSIPTYIVMTRNMYPFFIINCILLLNIVRFHFTLNIDNCVVSIISKSTLR